MRYSAGSEALGLSECLFSIVEIESSHSDELPSSSILVPHFCKYHRPRRIDFEEFFPSVGIISTSGQTLQISIALASPDS